MDADNFNNFVLYCKNIQPQRQEVVRRFFEGVVGFPYDQELLLQAFLFLNIETLFPSCIELLLFEKSPIENYTHLGKCDFVYLTTQSSLLLIETKFINTRAIGATERKRRNMHRNKVFEQVLSLKNLFMKYWNISTERLECGVFTTDPELVKRGHDVNVIARAVNIYSLEEWQQKYKIGGQ